MLMIQRNVGVCIVGHIRTFFFPNIQRGFTDAFLNTFDTPLVHGILFTSKRVPPFAKFDVPQSSESMHRVLVEFDQLYQFKESNCYTYKTFTKKRSCFENVAWLQIAWVKQCFMTLPPDTDLYVRARPDSFFAYVPPLRVQYDGVVTWEKKDAPASDQFFVLGRGAYANWFVKFAPHGCCAESHPDWNERHAIQNLNILGCIARSNSTVSCWKSNATQVRIIKHALLREDTKKF